MHLRDVGREAKILGDVRVVLRRVVAVRDEADAEVFAGLQLAGLVDVVAKENIALCHAHQCARLPNALPLLSS